VVRAWRPDIVHSNGFKMHVLAALVRPSGARVIWHIHDFVTNRPVMARLLRALSPRCSLAVANSRAVGADTVAALGAGTRVQVVLNAVDSARFAPDGPADDLDAAAGLPPAPSGTIRVGLVATLAHWKGHEVFLSAIARLPRDCTVRAYVVSGPVYQTAGSQLALDALRGSAARLGIADRVAFTGFRPDAARAMRALDVVVHASTEPEPFGLVIAEAMASARAVVFSAAGGARELAVPEVEALAHEPGDADTLARQIERLVLDRDLRARLGAAARAAAESRFSRARLGREIVEAWRSAGTPHA
jgi:glycosyltransferase involved in cell wall biosynthesis